VPVLPLCAANTVLPDGYKKLSLTVVVAHNFQSAGGDELTVAKGETLSVTGELPGGWYVVKTADGSKRGIVPIGFVKPVA
jgi:hypothetical protein